MAQFCENCGTPLVPDSRFCEKCGKPVPTESPQPVSGQGTPPPSSPPPPAYSQPAPAQIAKEIPKSNAKYLIGGIAVVIILAAGGGAYYYLANRTPDNVNQQQQVPVTSTPQPAPANTRSTKPETLPMASSQNQRTTTSQDQKSVKNIPATQPVSSKPITKTFNNPVYKGYRLDWCLNWAVNCGKPAADRFCQGKGYSGATKWEMAKDIGATAPTYVMGDGKICDKDFCDGFKIIVCGK